MRTMQGDGQGMMNIYSNVLRAMRTMLCIAVLLLVISPLLLSFVGMRLCIAVLLLGGLGLLAQRLSLVAMNCRFAAYNPVLSSFQNESSAVLSA